MANNTFWGLGNETYLEKLENPYKNKMLRFNAFMLPKRDTLVLITYLFV